MCDQSQQPTGKLAQSSSCQTALSRPALSVHQHHHTLISATLLYSQLWCIHVWQSNLKANWRIHQDIHCTKQFSVNNTVGFLQIIISSVTDQIWCIHNQSWISVKVGWYTCKVYLYKFNANGASMMMTLMTDRDESLIRELARMTRLN